ncbi:MAG: ATP-binding protein [Angustibacter sp.]
MLQRIRQRLDTVPLRDRLVAVLVVITLVALVVTGASAVSLLRGELVGKLDNQITSSLRAWLRDPVRDTGRPRGLPTNVYGAVVFDDGQSLLINRGLTARAPDLRAITSERTTRRDGLPFTVRGRGGDDWRVVAVRAQDTATGQAVTVVVGQPLADVQDTVTRMRQILLLIGMAVLSTVGLLGWMVIRRSLRPLREVETVAGAIAAGDLGQRVPRQPESTEVGRLATALNAMLAQIERAFRAQAASEERMRRFVSDASHELRTPLAAVRGYAELYRQGAVRQPDDVASVMRRIETEATRMGGLVEDLLTLARLDEQRPLHRTPVDLTVLAADAVQDARALDPGRDVTLLGRDGPVAPVMVLGDEARLRQVVGNLVANALRHTPPGTPVEIAVGRDPGDAPGLGPPPQSSTASVPLGPTASAPLRPTASAPATGSPSAAVAPSQATAASPVYGVIEVRDHGPGIPAALVGQVFERFFRADASRQRRSGGTGLGLAIVAAIVTAHDGQVGIRQTLGGGATLAVRIPAARSGPMTDEDMDDEASNAGPADDVQSQVKETDLR